MQQFFLGRQPILDSDGVTVAYELLFRSSNTNAYDSSVDGDSATSQVLINAITELGIDNIVGGKLAFINLTNFFLESPKLLEFLPADRVVLEVLETIEVNDAVITGVEALKRAGYTIALDDFVRSKEFEPLVALADIIKYDITQYQTDELCDIAALRITAYPKLLAERVETAEEFKTYRAAGFDYFQGYYFAKPEVVSGSKIPSDKITLLQLLAQINDEHVTLDEVADVMSRDVSLGVRALKYVNSPLSGVKHEITSIKQAAVLLGRDTIRNWVVLLMVANMNDKPPELFNMSLIRGRFCQLCAQREQLDDDSAYFTVGLLSLLDAMMDLDMDQVLDSISATKELRNTLQLNEGRASELLDVVRFLEASDATPGAGDAIIDDAMNDAYIEAIGWAEQASQLMAAWS
jgi:EAL and modified HD-GYP domain-containing signal transduction protein